jgi:hypothetical protein
MSFLRRFVLVVVAAGLVLGAIAFAKHFFGHGGGPIRDEAMAAGRAPDSFTAAPEDYFHDMDGGIALTPAEIRGRNTWIVWSAGNDRLWDGLNATSYGALDFLKTISSHSALPNSRDNRWNYLGLVNEPCFEKATGPDPSRHGLWLDKRIVSPECPPDPFEDAAKYPGVKTGARGDTMDAGSYYGYATGVVGLRLFPNPAFDANAAKQWDPVRYYTDQSYYNRKDLIKPYRVGMSCGFCHVGPNPVNPPADPEHPKWANLSSNVGAQYFWFDRIFVFKPDERSFVSQLFHTARPGTLDTSLVSADNINNPRTMNALYLTGPRVLHAKRWGQEKLAGGELDNRQLNDYVKDGPLAALFEPPDTVYTPRVLKDGADSVGIMGALNRVYINIGTDSEEWLTHFNPIVGGKRITPIEIKVARANSAYFAATEHQTFDMAQFLIRAGAPHRLADAPGGKAYLTGDDTVVTRGKVVFAETCARCHSSKLPAKVEGLDPNGCAGPQYLTCWDKYWQSTKTPEFKQQMRDIVLAKDFLDDNYLSTDTRVPVTLLRTNACSPLATNAIRGNIWNDFSSETYKNLPSVGDITYYHPYTGEPRTYHMPAGGRGYTRPPSLISLWSTAPFLLNNSVGNFEASPSVDARMRSFNDSIEKMLWPDRREHDDLLGAKVPGRMDRTSATSYIDVAYGYLPEAVELLRIDPKARDLFGPTGLQIGPIPAGTPVNLLANLDLLHDDKAKLAGTVFALLRDLRSLPKDASDEQAKRAFGNLVEPLLSVSKCPDFIVNRGHYFGTGYVEPGTTDLIDEPALSDDDKRALIEFLKTF